MKILYIIDKMVSAGAQKHLLEVLKNIDRKRFEPYLVCLLHGGGLIKEVESLGINVKVLGLRKLNSPSGLIGTIKLARFIRKEKFDIVHNYLFAASIFGTIAARAAGVKTIVTSRRDTGMLREGKWQHILAYRFTNKWVSKIVCVTKSVAEIAITKEKVGKDKVEVIYNGVGIGSRYVKTPHPLYHSLRSGTGQADPLPTGERELVCPTFREALGVEKNERVVTMVANFSWIKGHEDFIEAAELVLKEMPDVKFLLVGDGPLREEIEEKASKMVNTPHPNPLPGGERGLVSQPPFLFLGKRSDVAEILSITDVSVNASYSEGMSNTILESMAAGVPVVATAVDGNLETVVDNTTGILVPPKDPKAMANAIVKILKDKGLAQRLGRNAREIVKGQFSSEVMVRNMENLYERILEPKVAFIMPQFPRYDETFIAREMLELYNTGLDLYIFSLQPSRDKITHKEIEPLLKKTINANFLLSFSLLSAHLYFILRHPLKYISSLAMIFAQLYKSPRYLVRALAVFPKSVYFARLSQYLGIRHVHGQWATTPTVTAMIISRLTGVPFSFSGHAHDIHVDTVGLKDKIEKAEFVTTCTCDNKRYLIEMMDKESTVHRPQSTVQSTVDSRQSTKSNAFSRKILVSYHGLDVERFEVNTPHPTPLPCGERESVSLKILSVGSLLPCKGFEVLIDACAILKDKGIGFECTIAGGGALEKELKEKVKRQKLEGNVKFTGYITQEELIPLYQETDIFVLPVRLDIHWGIPNVLLEAMACAKPVITTNLPSIPELVENNKNGFIVKEDDPKQTAGAIEILYYDEDLRRELGENGKKVTIEKFDIRKNVEELKAIFDKSLDKRRCTTCGSYDTHVLIEARASRDANVVRCRRCNVIFLEGTASKEIYSVLSSAYWREKGDQKKIYTDDTVSEGIDNEFSKRISKIDSLIDKKGSILDVGCDIGQFLEIAKNDGWDCSGLDISPEAVDYVKNKLGIDALCKDLKENSFSNEQFDAVTMWDVIEHLQDPAGDIRIINSILKKDGILAIKTPNEAGLFKEIGKLIYRASFGKINFHLKYLYYSPHYHYFYPRTLSKILRDNGFEIMDIEYDDTNIEFAKKKLDKHYGRYPSSRFLSFTLKPLCLLAALLKRQNKMVIYARKVKV